MEFYNFFTLFIRSLDIREVHATNAWTLRLSIFFTVSAVSFNKWLTFNTLCCLLQTVLEKTAKSVWGNSWVNFSWDYFLKVHDHTIHLGSIPPLGKASLLSYEQKKIFAQNPLICTYSSDRPFWILWGKKILLKVS